MSKEWVAAMASRWQTWVAAALAVIVALSAVKGFLDGVSFVIGLRDTLTQLGVFVSHPVVVALCLIGAAIFLWWASKETHAKLAAQQLALDHENRRVLNPLIGALQHISAFQSLRMAELASADIPHLLEKQAKLIEAAKKGRVDFANVDDHFHRPLQEALQKAEAIDWKYCNVQYDHSTPSYVRPDNPIQHETNKFYLYIEPHKEPKFLKRWEDDFETSKGYLTKALDGLKEQRLRLENSAPMIFAKVG